MYDFLIVGGGVVGLSLAWELSDFGSDVCIVDRASSGRAASWVGTGIFPPPQSGAKQDPLEQLRTISHPLHVEWSRRLRADTGIDNELRKCGGIYFARRKGEATALRVSMQQRADDGVDVEPLTIEQLTVLEPALASIADEVKVAYLLRDEYQIRSPRHLKALIAACEKRGVEIRSDVDVFELTTNGASILHAQSNRGQLEAKQFVLCGGSWTSKLLERLGGSLPVEPWRGQLILWKTPTPVVTHVVNEGFRYLVPRLDGHLIVGATVEDVGFDSRTTEDAIDELREYSCQLVPALRNETVKQTWAGLRPKTPDGIPFMGRVPGYTNLSVATGHYRSGLHLSPATAVFMRQLLLDDKTDIDPAVFRLNR